MNLHHWISKVAVWGVSRGYDNACVYEGPDEFIDMFNGKLKTADILVSPDLFVTVFIVTMEDVF